MHVRLLRLGAGAFALRVDVLGVYAILEGVLARVLPRRQRDRVAGVDADQFSAGARVDLGVKRVPGGPVADGAAWAVALLDALEGGLSLLALADDLLAERLLAGKEVGKGEKTGDKEQSRSEAHGEGATGKAQLQLF